MPSVDHFNKRLEALRTERTSFIPLWRELSDYHLAHRGRFLLTDRNKGHKRNTKQINNKSRLSVRTLASGMMAGITSPARPWFRLSAADPQLDESTAVKQWLHDVQEIMYRVFSASNTYNSLHNVYTELGTFGTAPLGVYQDFDNVIFCKPYTVGSYFIATNPKGEVDTFYREYQETVGQIVQQFGYDNCSNHIQQQWDKGNTESWIDLVHAIEPNDDRDMTSPLAKDKRFRSVYYEKKAKTGSSTFLRQSGFNTFPILAPRWEITAEDVYATDCPGMIALGDTKSLQLAEKRKFQAVDKVVNPPMSAPNSVKSKMPTGGPQPNDIIYTGNDNEKIESLYNMRPDLNALEAMINNIEERVSRAFFEDLFLMLSMSDRRQITAREVAEKHEEKLLMLGPVLERLHNELLGPLIDRTFNILQEAGVLPVPPEELQNREISVEYVSVLAQAQRMVSTGGIERVTQFAASIAAVWPEAQFKIDAGQAIDDYADSIGTNPNIVRSDEEVAQMQAAAQQAAAQQAAAAQGQQMADTAKTVSEVDTGGENALTDMMRNAGLL